ncbi:hypothetical protein EN943_24045 [Mesorhizobium sp. M7A.F.Ca.US.006.01.1.1]|uniref:hypothetical protein n=1 Tax=Mesorhizobium sp. M7A.F.Ca.US.006.01.1.1 TaxID=2496707 RepID=UPI000FCA5535|nr:hypothetical protein [Mesorhizobium sp. M7A.F.Ca.US.006.01.1.1]RUZ74405.1 hypothetical protein EN943_24045 [Mesorhizobium sp. M7A.F.Ca.US.006.01.1.1]
MVGSMAYVAGYASALHLKVRSSVRQSLRLDWQSVTFGPLYARTPIGWGSFEPGRDGDIVLHNRPRRLRVDGDAVWYGSAIEIRVGPLPYDNRLADLSAMRTLRRQFGAAGASLFAELRVARGVLQARQSEAVAVFHSLRLTDRSVAIAWPDREARGPGNTQQRPKILHASRVARDFERFDNQQGDKADD